MNSAVTHLHKSILRGVVSIRGFVAIYMIFMVMQILNNIEKLRAWSLNSGFK